ncbi:MAG: hypothetical protein WB770_09885 [Acidimicrobiales bacterium]
MSVILASVGHGPVHPAAGLFSFGLSAFVNAFLGGLSRWVESGTSVLISAFGHVLTATTKVPFGTGFFSEFDVVAKIGALLAGPFLLLAVVHAIIRQDLGVLWKAVFLRLPLALVFGGIAVALVAQALAITDSLSAAMLDVAGSSAREEIAFLAAAFAPGGIAFAGFLGLLLALMAAVVAFVLWVELVIRSAAIAVATLFIPIALSGLVWSATSHWARRVGETLAALIVSKLVIAGVLALAAISLAPGNGLAGTIQAIALLLLACLAPFSLLRLVPIVEAGAIAHFEGMSRRAHRSAHDAVATSLGLIDVPQESVTKVSHDAVTSLPGIDLADPSLEAEAADIRSHFPIVPVDSSTPRATDTRPSDREQTE